MTILENLRKVALAATQGPWSYCEDEEHLHADTMQDAGGEPYHIIHNDGSIAVKNQKHIATFNPTTVLALLDALQEAREALEFYGSLGNWKVDMETMRCTVITGGDCENKGGVPRAGKRARATLSRIDAKLEELK
jgi:hypothetical protein